jgi:hypothetical protein
VRVYALYEEPESVQRAVDALRAAGIADREIVVISSEPYEEYEFSHRDKATWLHWIAGAGGAVGMTVGYWLASTTSRLWPLPTAGMPIVAMWPTLIVMFEMTMLGAILATVTTLFITAKVPGREPTLYDAGVSEGLILVGVENPPAAALDDLKERLDLGGRGRVRTVEGHG